MIEICVLVGMGPWQVLTLAWVVDQGFPRGDIFTGAVVSGILSSYETA